MEQIPIEKLADRVGSRFSLTVAAAKRARQIKEGAIPLVKCGSNHPLTIALHEMAAGKVVVKELGEAGDEFITDGRSEDAPEDALGETDLFDGDLFGLDDDDEVPDEVDEATEEDEEDEEEEDEPDEEDDE